jgi:3',5'-cyclic AMP phosphodiesterase CpdA
MLIAQITDIHLGFEQGNPDELNQKRLEQAIAALLALEPRPDLLLVTGDVADGGDDREAYQRFRAATAQLPFPVFALPGNHDGRAAFAEAFGEVPGAGGFVQYAIEQWPVRILVLDSLDEGRHGGAFCEARAGWLAARLDEARERPTLIALHHPPSETGLSWMGEHREVPWALRLEALVLGRANIVGVVAGHIHRPIVTQWAGTTLAICPSVAPQVALDLGELDADRPDGRPMIVEGPPAFALHLWTGRQLLSHFATAAEPPVLARFTPRLQPLLRKLAREREER